MNTMLLRPTDILFFRDGRPMEGSLSGHGAAWPLPNVTDAAIHAALHRSGLAGHRHDHVANGNRAKTDVREFGSLVTAGPFPVRQNAKDTVWYFPRPLDLVDDSLTPALLPTHSFDSVQSSLPDPLKYPVASRLAPDKNSKAPQWLGADTYASYLQSHLSDACLVQGVNDGDIFDSEASIGIAIDPATGTTGQGDAAGKIYSAQYLRLRDNWQMGVLAKTKEKVPPGKSPDLIPSLVDSSRHILVGGQQRICTASLHSGPGIPLPLGRSSGFRNGDGKWRVKWILLSPAIWPAISSQSRSGTPMNAHRGGFLPNWVCPSSGQVLLKSGKSAQRRYSGKVSRGFDGSAEAIGARLVAALVPKPLVVTGWSLANEMVDRKAGAKSVHLAVPAGAIYYIEADSENEAVKLARVLNWNGDSLHPETIANRRSTLMGEKGFGLGVCGTWDFFPDVTGRPKPRQPD